MAINPETQYAGKITPASSEYPYGEARNIATPGDGTGTPWEAALVNDIFGLQQALLSEAAITPSGNPDRVGASQYLDALNSLLSRHATSINDLRNTAGTKDGQGVIVQGESDSLIFANWDASSTAEDNGATVFAVSGVPTGRWVATLRTPSQVLKETIRQVLGAGPYVIVCTGQSNAVGRCTGGTFKVDPAVKMWNITAGEFQTADFENVSYSLDMGGGDTAGGGKNNPALAFCHRLHEETGEDVYLILNGRGGSSITNWDTGTFTTTLKSTIANALADPTAPGKTTVDALLWIQGEQDIFDAMDHDTYAGHRENFINSMDAEPYFTTNTPVCVSPVPQFYIETAESGNNGVQEFLSGVGAQFVEKYGRTFVPSVSALTSCDGSHYSGPSCWELGYNRFMYALNEIQNPHPDSNPAVTGAIRQKENFAYFMGRDAGANFDPDTWGTDAVMLGRLAGSSLTSVGLYNWLQGVQALVNNTSIGNNNMVLGRVNGTGAAPAATLGDQNVVMGYRAIENLDGGGTSSNNVIMGFAAGFGTSVLGNNNVISGPQAGRAGSIGNGNIFIGAGAAGNTAITEVGGENVAIGVNALGGSAAAGTLGTGSTRHVAIGANSANNLNTDSGSNGSVTCVGNNAGGFFQDASPMESASNVTILGKFAKVSGNNQVQLGDSTTTTYVFGAVQDRSDERDKADVQPLTDAHIAFFMDVEWRLFRWDYRDDYYETVETDDGPEIIKHEKDGSKKRSRLHVGAIAQQVEAAMEKHGVDFAGLQHHARNGGCDVYTLGYEEFIGIQGEIIQRQQKRMDDIEARLRAAGL